MNFEWGEWTEYTRKAIKRNIPSLCIFASPKCVVHTPLHFFSSVLPQHSQAYSLFLGQIRIFWTIPKSQFRSEIEVREPKKVKVSHPLPEECLSYSGGKIGRKLSEARPPGKRRGQISKKSIGHCLYLSWEKNCAACNRDMEYYLGLNIRSSMIDDDLMMGCFRSQLGGVMSRYQLRFIRLVTGQWPI